MPANLTDNIEVQNRPIKYGRGKFAAKPEFIAYMNMIADSPVYDGLPEVKGTNGKINWQCSSGKTTSFYKAFEGRFKWWVNKADELGLPGSNNQNDRLTIAARKIHPTGKKVCLICGKERYIGYMYINANFAKALNKLTDSSAFHKAMLVHEAMELLEEAKGKAAAKQFILKTFPERAEKIYFINSSNYKEFFISTQDIRSTKLSPGYMGDCPHRLDGIHDYCIFCRKPNDPGRSDENMQTYNHDRRAFEWWAEGDWKVADTLYNLAGPGKCANPDCNKVLKKVSPDHVGPLSCGFRQNAFFEPLCKRCNSAKNRRFTMNNVNSLIHYEEIKKESVAGWQVRVLWDKTKKEIANDSDSKILSNYMRAMQDYYLRLLVYIASLGYFELLTCYLHPEYAYKTVEFVGLDTSALSFKTIIETENFSTGARSLAARSVRIAFEELFAYCSKPEKKRKSIILKTTNKFLSIDYGKVKELLSHIPLTAMDRNLQIALSGEAKTLEQKDAEIKKIIESPDFKNRISNYKEPMNQLQLLVDKRGYG